MRYLLVFILFCCQTLWSQTLQIEVLDAQTNARIEDASITIKGSTPIQSQNGFFSFTTASLPIQLLIKAPFYISDTIILQEVPSTLLKVVLQAQIQDQKTVVVSAGKRRQAIEDIPVSMEIIRPQLIDNKGITDLEQAVDQTPGVYTMDGQVSIRGGSGFAYGTGSRVLLLWNGMPLLSGYAGDTQWNAIPMEQASQVEVMKGAASVLYGSGALNGIIALAEKEPTLTPVTKVKVQYGLYGAPRRSSLKWWTTPPMNQQLEVFHSALKKRFGYTLSTTGFHNDGYRLGESEFRGRVSGTIYAKAILDKRLKAGLGYNFQVQKTGNFLIWQNDSLGYTPSGYGDTTSGVSTVSYNFGQRLFLDPYAKFIDKNNNLHQLKTRLYWVSNENLSNSSQSNAATISYADYTFQHKFGQGSTLSTGITAIQNVVNSELFGNHNSQNYAAYSQLEYHKNKLDLSAGVRLEYFEMDGNKPDSQFQLPGKDSLFVPVYPVLRTGLHYALKPFTHLRASFGQGIRYPSVAERFTQTSVGALNIFPNPELRPEIGWAGEIGIKQGFKIGNWKAMIDAALFLNQYSNMMEFSFIYYNPITQQPLNPLNPSPEDIEFLTSGQYNISDWVGFQAQNAEKARISGLDLSFNSAGQLGNVELVSLIGYTYMNPISLNSTPQYIANFSDTTTNMLKYRFKHLAKADVEATYQKISFGASMRYNSFMRNIDRVFEDDLDPSLTSEVYILPGLKAYRQKFNGGNLVFDARFAYLLKEQYRISFIVNNLLNAEVTSRPGDIQAPRLFMLQLQAKF
ncbi:MAG: TonB-dependent receptor [Cryomorphaceae bacterium]|jgi:iron complex outermembrane receptor protein|nr:TonB-dependent receptor [Cryomorphaceae bacterium]